jgi:hypothetical protein
MATLSLSDLDSLPDVSGGNVLTLDDLAKLDPKQPSQPQQPLGWGDVALGAAKNAIPSTVNLVAGVANAVAHPIDTAQGIYDVGKGAVSKAAGALGVQQDPATKAQNEAQINALRDFYVNRYGSMEGFKKALSEDPAGIAADLSTIFAGPELALARAPGAVGRVGEIAGTASRATNPLTAVGKVASKVVEPVVSNVIGSTTGVGAMPLRQAARAGYAGDTVLPANMRGQVPIDTVVDSARSALGGMRQDRSAAYKANMASVNSGPAHVGYQPIYNALNDADSMVNYQGLAKSDDALKTLNQIKDKVSEWRGLSNPYTVEGADALKQAIGEIRQSTQPGTLSRTVASNVYNAAKQSIVQQAPEYAKAMADYSKASDQIGELQRTFSLGEKASRDTTLRKLQSTMRNNVNTNYGQRTKLLDELAQYEPSLPNALAGQTLSSATPRGLSGLGAITVGGGGVAMHGLPALMNPTSLAALPFFSPRIMGEAAYAAGKAAKGTRAKPILSLLPSIIQGGYPVSVLSGGIGPRYDDNGNLLPGQ